MHKLLPLLSILALGACTATATISADGTTTPAPSGLEALAQFTIADLQAADADAVAHNDVLAHDCYPALIQFVQSLPTSGGTVSGAFSAFQKKRDLQNGVRSGLPMYLRRGCGALVVDEEAMIARLAAIGGAAVALPGLPIP